MKIPVTKFPWKDSVNLLGLLSVISSLTFIASEVMGIYVYRLEKIAEINRPFFNIGIYNKYTV